MPLARSSFPIDLPDAGRLYVCRLRKCMLRISRPIKRGPDFQERNALPVETKDEIQFRPSLFVLRSNLIQKTTNCLSDLLTIQSAHIFSNNATARWTHN